MIFNTKSIIYIIPTPIGNLKDITIRAIEILKKSDYIIVESYNKSIILLKKYNIKKKIIILNGKNEKLISNNIINKIYINNYIYTLISDAGTPLINDPGFYLIKKSIKLGIKIISIPGACAAITALVASGFKCNKFIYEGYFPKKNTKKKKLLNNLLLETRTVILYESCHRLIDTINYISSNIDKKRKIVIAKELTKLWEIYYRGNFFEILKIFNNKKIILKGEFIIIIQGIKYIPDNKNINSFLKNIFININKFLSFKDSIKLITNIFNIKKNKIYSFLNKNKKI